MIKALVNYFNENFKRKLIFVALIFLVPLFYVCYNLNALYNKDINIAKKEIAGAFVLNDIFLLQADYIENYAINGDRKNFNSIKYLEAIKNNLPTNNLTLKASNEIRQLINLINYKEDTSEDKYYNVKKNFDSVINTIAEDYGIYTDPEMSSYTLTVIGVNAYSELLNNVYEYYKLKKHTNIVDDGQNKQHELFIARDRLLNSFEKYKQLSKSAIKWSDGGVYAEQLNSDIVRIDRSINSFIDSKDINNNDELAIIVFEDIKSTNNISQKAFVDVLGKRLNIIENTRNLQFIISLIVFSLTCIFVIYILTNGIIAPLNDITNSMTNVADGDYKFPISGLERKDEIGTIAKALKILRDNSFARIEAEKATKAKSEFLAIISHEIRTPMNGVLGMAQSLKLTNLNDEQQDMLHIIEDSGMALVALLDDILDMSKIEANKIEIENIRMSPCATIKGAIKLFRPKAEQKGLKIYSEIEKDAEGWFLGDPNRLRQVIYNLLSNSIKFTPHGEIKISLEVLAENKLLFKIKDTGIGIAKDKIDILFDRFTQADNSTTRVYGGSGLGLSIVKGLVNLMGGEINVETKEGEGSCFYFTIICEPTIAPSSIPCDGCKNTMNNHCVNSSLKYGSSIQIEDKTNNIDDDDATGAADNQIYDSNLVILVADDNKTNQDVLKTILESIGADVDFVENGKVAFDTWQMKHYDIVLMDVQMPIWDGITAIRKIREQEIIRDLRRTPIITISANCRQADIQDQLKAGADGFVTKPLNISKLITQINKAIEDCDRLNNDSHNIELTYL